MRQRLFVIGISLLFVIAGVHALTSSPSKPRPQATPTPTSAATAVFAAPQAAPVSGSASTSVSAVHTARAFLAEYIRYQYGSKDVIFEDVEPTLRQTLLSEPPTVPASVRKRTAKVIDLQVLSASDVAVVVAALLRDSNGSKYPVRVELIDRNGIWMVTKLGG